MTEINLVLMIGGNAFLLLLVASSVAEKEYRAALVSGSLIPVYTAAWLVFMLVPGGLVAALNIAAVAAVSLFVLLSLVPYFPKREPRDLQGIEPYDERDHMFSRNNLQHHPELAEKYYAAQGDKKEIDEKIQAKPELYEFGHAYDDEYYSPVFNAAFSYLDRTRFASRGAPAADKQPVDTQKITRAIRETALSYGAVDVGITKLLPRHLYSHTGRHAENWGKKVENTHTWAVVIVVGMKVEQIKQAPGLPVILESARQYVEAAKIANIVGEYIRSFGYDARAHTDGNYELLCVPPAVDAGLGELGRMGIFMHPVHGPCVRISLVTTDLELVASLPRKKPFRIEEFCLVCKKCAGNCPSGSIVKGEEPVSRGFRHWSVNQEQCFSYWKHTGTDCAFCIAVCPYTKPDTLVHKLVRFYISRNPLNQRLALFFDDLLYGRKKTVPPKNPPQFFN